MANERDTHFQGFAKLLWDELLHVNEFGYIEISDDEEEACVRYQHLIAQRAYDLAVHTLEQFEQQYDWGFGTLDSPLDVLQKIPDLTAWPDTSPPS